MLLEDLQTQTKTALEAHAFFSGFTWLIEDGKADNRDAALAALESTGIYGTIQRAQYGEVTSQNRKLVTEDFLLPITITEFPDFNRDDPAGFGFPAEQCTTEVMKALVPNTQVTQTGVYRLLEESRRYLGADEGAEIWLMNFMVKISTATE